MTEQQDSGELQRFAKIFRIKALIDQIQHEQNALVALESQLICEQQSIISRDQAILTSKQAHHDDMQHTLYHTQDILRDQQIGLSKTQKQLSDEQHKLTTELFTKHQQILHSFERIQALGNELELLTSSLKQEEKQLGKMGSSE